MSVLSVHFLDQGSTPGRNFVKTIKPKMGLVANDFGVALDLVADAPGIQVIGRIVDDYDANAVARSGQDPIIAAQVYVWNRLITYQANPHIKIWTGPNEPVFGQANDPANVTAFLWYCEFEAERCRLMNAYGLRCAVGNFSTGNPDMLMWDVAGQMLNAVLLYDGWLGVHEYQDPPYFGGAALYGTPGGGTPVDGLAGLYSSADWTWLFLRCKRVHETILIPKGYGGIRWAVTECGTIRGWRGIGLTIDQYVNWLVQYDTALSQLPYVDTATIFSAGKTAGTQWDTFGVDSPDVLTPLSAKLTPGGAIIPPVLPPPPIPPPIIPPPVVPPPVVPPPSTLPHPFGTRTNGQMTDLFKATFGYAPIDHEPVMMRAGLIDIVSYLVAPIEYDWRKYGATVESLTGLTAVEQGFLISQMKAWNWI